MMTSVCHTLQKKYPNHLKTCLKKSANLLIILYYTRSPLLRLNSTVTLIPNACRVQSESLNMISGENVFGFSMGAHNQIGIPNITKAHHNTNLDHSHFELWRNYCQPQPILGIEKKCIQLIGKPNEWRPMLRRQHSNIWCKHNISRIIELNLHWFLDEVPILWHSFVYV